MSGESGTLRRVVLLGVFCWLYARYVVNGSLFNWSPEVRECLGWVLYASVAWGVITLFANARPRTSVRNEEITDDDDPRTPT